MPNFNVNLNIGGFSELAKAMGLRGKAVEQAKNVAIDKIAETIQLYARTNVGHPDHPNPMTFTLNKSILWKHTGDGQARVYTMLDYAYWVEFGHSQEPGRYVPDINARLVADFVPAYPFFRPALTEVIDGGEAERIIINTLENAVKNGDGGGGTSEGMEADVAAPEDVAAVAAL